MLPPAEITHYRPTAIRIRSIHTMTPSKVQRLTDKMAAGEAVIGRASHVVQPRLVEILA
jgi:hypothetical protein